MSTNLGLLYGSTYGSLYFAAVMSTAFFGITCVQTFFYYVHYPNDHFHMKMFVALLWTLNTIHEALAITGVYKFIMAGLANPLPFVTGNPELVLQYLLTAFAALPTQGFFVYRIYIVSGKNIVAPIVWIVLALIQLVTATIYVGKSLVHMNGVPIAELGVPNHGSLETAATICLSVAAGADIVIAVCMASLLVRERLATNFASTAHILERLIMFAVNTGTWTAVFSLLGIILLHVFPMNALYAVFTVPLCPVYCNTLLANLNVRACIRDGDTMAPNISTDLSHPTNLDVWKVREGVEVTDTDQPFTTDNV